MKKKNVQIMKLRKKKIFRANDHCVFGCQLVLYFSALREDLNFRYFCVIRTKE